jgi:hypothetical protein
VNNVMNRSRTQHTRQSETMARSGLLAMKDSRC